MKNVKEICIKIKDFTGIYPVTIGCLSKLKKLKRLEVNCNRISIAPDVNALASKKLIEYLGITQTALNEDLCNVMSKMTTLKTIKLISSPIFFKDFTKQQTKRLNRIERLFLVDCSGTDFGT